MYFPWKAAIFNLICLHWKIAHAQCGNYSCGSITYKDDSLCGVDPLDASDIRLVIWVCNCYANDRYLFDADNIGGAGGIEEVSSSASTLQPVTFDLAGFPNTMFDPGYLVSVYFNEYEDDRYGQLYYTYSPVHSIVATVLTTSVTTTSAHTVSSTSTVVLTRTTAIPQQTSTKKCTTGTLTSSAPTATMTSTSTITQPPKTVHKLTVVFSTTTIKCVSTYPRQHIDRELPEPVQNLRRRDKALDGRQYNAGTFETPYCPALRGPPKTTTYYTSTVVRTETVVSTSTDTVVVTSTSTSTSTPSPATTTLCQNVQATTTFTPVATSTVITRPPRSTVTVTKAYTFTQTAFSKGRPQFCVPHYSTTSTTQTTKPYSS